MWCKNQSNVVRRVCGASAQSTNYSSSKRNLSIVKIQPIESIFLMQSNLQFKNKAPNYKFIGGSECKNKTKKQERGNRRKMTGMDEWWQASKQASEQHERNKWMNEWTNNQTNKQMQTQWKKLWMWHTRLSSGCCSFFSWRQNRFQIENTKCIDFYSFIWIMKWGEKRRNRVQCTVHGAHAYTQAHTHRGKQIFIAFELNFQ